MNYFNYFTEIEQEFVKRRGSHMLVSPLDWALIENWQQRGIPLHIVLRGITSSFDGYDARAHRGRRVNSLFFCRQEVEAMFLEYSAAHVGSNGRADEADADAGADAESPFSAATVIAYLKESRDALERVRERHPSDSILHEMLVRTAERLAGILEDLERSGLRDPEGLETDLMMIEEVILDGLKAQTSEERLAELRKEGKQQLRAYKQTMERDVYEQTLGSFIARRLREEYRVPRLSLFYL
ncbi:MAG: hypothetical protein SF339_11120 [Blastocatellia bacterium]|nr:hypothetical protein [Blastocatellia bacterium]